MARLTKLDQLLAEVRACRICDSELPLGANPVLRAKRSARILIIGQAPGTKVHHSGIPWNDPSGKRLREWLQLTDKDFYDESKIAIIPMGFCYPGAVQAICRHAKNVQRYGIKSSCIYCPILNLLY